MLPRVIHDPTEFRAACREARKRGARVGMIPTMGALHDGHLALVDEAKTRASCVAVSIFVNPTQFGPNEDFARYPRTLDADVAKLATRDVDLVFAPEASGMYPPGDTTRVNVDALAAHLCGPFRPGHFQGVATVVTKLLSLAGESVAVFGRKDYQQLTIVRRLVTDLFLPVEIVGLRTIRETDGLARSSRNAYLDADGREKALGLVRGLRAAFDRFASGERRAGALRQAARGPVEATARAIDYVEVATPDALEPYGDDAIVGERTLIAIAAHVGATRLIDNVVLGEDPRPSGG